MMMDMTYMECEGVVIYYDECIPSLVVRTRYWSYASCTIYCAGTSILHPDLYYTYHTFFSRIQRHDIYM